MLVRQGRSFFHNPWSLTGQYSNQIGNWVKGGLRNRFVGGFSEIFGGLCNGHLAPSSFILPQKSGAISSYRESFSSLFVSATLTPAMPMLLTGGMVLTASTLQLDKIIEMLASGTLSLTELTALLSAGVMMDADGGSLLTGSIQMGGVFGVSGSSASGLTPSAVLSARAFMVASAGGPTPLSPEGLANAVWSKLAAEANDPGTMGEKLNDAGSASNPWTEIIEGSLSASDVLKLLLAIQAGESTITDLGGGNATIVFKSLSGAVDRVTASVSGSERASVILDPS